MIRLLLLVALFAGATQAGDVAPPGWDQLPPMGCAIKGGIVYLEECAFFI